MVALLRLALFVPVAANDLFLDRSVLPADVADLKRLPSVRSAGTDEPIVGPSSLADMKAGNQFHGDCFSDPHAPVDWYDPARIVKGNAVFEKRGFPIVLSWTLALVVGLAYEPMGDVLVFTNQSDTIAKVINRYSRTGAFLGEWCAGDPMDPNNLAFNSVQTVRSYHEGVRKEITPVLDPIDGEKEWMTQYDMGIVQTAFLSCFAPTQTFGFTFTEDEQDDFIYLWRVIGHQLGIDDRFNVATEGRAATQQIIDDIFRQVVVPSLQNPPDNYGLLAGPFVGAMNLACLGLPCFTVGSLVGLSIVGYGEPMPAELSKADQFRANLLMTVIRLISKLPVLESLVSSYFVHVLSHVEPSLSDEQGSPLRHAASACPIFARRVPDFHTAHKQACASLPAGHPSDPAWCHSPSQPADNDGESGLPVKIKVLLMAPAATALALTTAATAMLAFGARSLFA
jgi:hypothetical protein